jgi:hypothetical protein
VQFFAVRGSDRNTAEHPGDFDGDGDVDYDDYLIFQTAFGTCDSDVDFLILHPAPRGFARVADELKIKMLLSTLRLAVN